MARTCPNCGTCTCTGSYLITMANNKVVCSKCVSIVMAQASKVEVPQTNNLTPGLNIDINKPNK